LPELSIDNVSKNEGDAGTKKYSFTISLSAALHKTIKVKYKTLDESATAPARLYSSRAVHRLHLILARCKNSKNNGE
jgi:hypothetical protein